VGGRGEKQKSRVFNFATQATRQPGSSLKPLAVYGPSLEAGMINYSTIIDDAPYEYREDGTGWPKNSPAGYKGLTPVINALTKSVNTVAIKLVDQYGLENSYEFLTKKLHFTTLHNNEVINGTVVNDVSLAALGLGGVTYGVTVRELVGGYTMFTNDGVYCEPRAVLRILDTDGEILINNELKTEVAMSKENASIMTKMMNNVMVNGTGASTKLKDRVFTAGKTGTTTKNNDRWFVGFTPYYLGGVWFGYEKAQSVAGFSGNSAMKIWDHCMTALHNEMVFQQKEDGSYDSKTDRFGNKIAKVYNDVIDPGVLTLNFCMDCGMLSTSACKDSRGSRSMIGYFTVDNMPEGYCTCHKVIRYCSGGGIATPFCPESTCKDVTVVVTDSAKDRYPDGNYAYRSDESYVFYDNGDGTYGGLITKYSRFCKKHTAPDVIPVSARSVLLAPPPKNSEDREFLD
jgi:penicillin-binding protein 1A